MANKKKLIKGPWSWTKDDIRLLKKLYPHGNTRKIAERLNRPLPAPAQPPVPAFSVPAPVDTSPQVAQIQVRAAQVRAGGHR